MINIKAMDTFSEIQEVYGEININGIIKSNRLPGHVWRWEGPTTGQVTKWEPKSKSPKGR